MCISSGLFYYTSIPTSEHFCNATICPFQTLLFVAYTVSDIKLYPPNFTSSTLPALHHPIQNLSIYFMSVTFVFLVVLNTCVAGGQCGCPTVRLAQSCTPAVWGRGSLEIEYTFGADLVMFILSTRCKVTLTGSIQ